MVVFFHHFIPVCLALTLLLSSIHSPSAKIFAFFVVSEKKMYIYIDFLSYPSYDTTSHDSNVHREDGMSLSSPGWESYTGRKRSRLRAEGRNVPSVKRNEESSKSETGKSNKYIFGKL